MKAKRLLVLCYFFPPLSGGGVHRVLGFTRHLPDHGWNCTVVCAGEEDYWVRDETLVARIRAGTEVVRVHGGSALSAWLRFKREDYGRRSGRSFARLRALSDWWWMPDSYAPWSARAARAAAGLLERGGYDAVLTTSPPDSVHRAGVSLAKRFRIPWVADFRDPWMGLHFRTPPTRWHRARHVAMEREVFDRADRVLAASATHAAAIHAVLDPESRARVVHLPNGYEPDPEDLPDRDPDPPEDLAGGDSKSSATFPLVYTGVLSMMPDVGVFLDAVHEVLARNPDARRRLRVRLAGPYDSGYEDRAIALGLKGIVEFLGPVSHAESRALQRRAGTLLLWKPDGFPAMVPGKLYEYLDSGRPLLALLEPGDESAVLVRRAGGAILPPRDRAALIAEIERRYRAWKAGESLPGGRPDWLDDHTRERLSGRLAQVLDGMIAAPSDRTR